MSMKRWSSWYIVIIISIDARRYSLICTRFENEITQHQIEYEPSSLFVMRWDSFSVGCLITQDSCHIDSIWWWQWYAVQQCNLVLYYCCLSWRSYEVHLSLDALSYRGSLLWCDVFQNSVMINDRNEGQSYTAGLHSNVIAMSDHISASIISISKCQDKMSGSYQFNMTTALGNDREISTGNQINADTNTYHLMIQCHYLFAHLIPPDNLHLVIFSSSLLLFFSLHLSPSLRSILLFLQFYYYHFNHLHYTSISVIIFQFFF